MFPLLTLCLIFASGVLNCSGLNRCINPNGNQGYCMPKKSCINLTKLANQDNLSFETQRFLEESQCVNEIGEHSNFCCTRDTGFTQKPVSLGSRGNHNRRPIATLPGRKNQLCHHCGPSSLVNKIYGGTNTTIDDYPWLALLEYDEDDDSQKYRCGGSLINHRYILTAAHCVKRKAANNFIRVRLGETDVTKDIDCDASGSCNHPPVDVGYEEVIIHEAYDSQRKLNDIALIRLERDVEFTNFIKPICLPDCNNNVKSSPPDKSLEVAGWGFTDNRKKFSPRKLKVGLPYVDRRTCNSRLLRKYVINDSQLCAGGVFNQDTCQGDSGGPLMRIENNTYYVEGVVSFGVECGTDYPGIYTKVSSYTDWIRQNIKP